MTRTAPGTGVEGGTPGGGGGGGHAEAGLHLVLAPGTEWAVHDGRLCLNRPGHGVETDLDPALPPLLDTLTRGVPVAEVAGDPRVLAFLGVNGFLHAELRSGHRTWLRYRPTSPGLPATPEFGPADPGPASSGTGADPGADSASPGLAAHAALRRVAGRWILHSPLATSVVEELHPRVVAWLAGTASGDVPEGPVTAVLGALGFLEPGPDRGPWGFADLLLHGTATGGRWPDPGEARPTAGSRPDRHGIGEALLLPRRDRATGDPLPTIALHDALDRRVSVRRYDDDDPLTRTALARLLETALAADHVGGPGGGGGPERRPYGSPGRRFAVDTWLVVRRCRGLEAGTFRYDPAAHALHRSQDPVLDPEGALRSARDGMGRWAAGASLPQVLLVLATDLERVAPRYGPTAYPLVLKEVGGMIQTLHLAAAALGLAGCALGAGDGLLFPPVHHPRADLRRVSVGAFCLGSAPGAHA